MLLGHWMYSRFCETDNIQNLTLESTNFCIMMKSPLIPTAELLLDLRAYI